MIEDLTAVVLTKNEQQRVGRCIRSLRACSCLIVLDSFSTDNTRSEVLEAWRELGRSESKLLFLQRRWRGFTDARNFSLQWVGTPWALWVDADEWIENDLEMALKKFDWKRRDCDVFRIPRKSWYLGHWVRFGGWYPDLKRRLGRTAEVVWKHGPKGADVHEDLYSLRNPAHMERLDGHLGHEPFQSVDEHRETNERYSSLLAEGLAQEYREGRRRPYFIAEIWIKVAIKFLENFFWKLGILDGFVGYRIAFGSAQSLYWRLTKAQKLFKNKEA